VMTEVDSSVAPKPDSICQPDVWNQLLVGLYSSTESSTRCVYINDSVMSNCCHSDAK